VGGRADAVRLVKPFVRELKPDNAKQIGRGVTRLQDYKRGLEIQFPGKCFKTELDTYQIIEIP
jgi:hypothetical protein